MSICSEIPIRGFHIDFNGHVNNCRFLEFFEEARWDYFSAFLDPSRPHNQQCQIVIARIAVDFLAPVGLGDVLQIEIEVVRIGTKSFTLKQCATSKQSGERIAEAEIVLVIVDMESKEALPLKGEVEQLVFENILNAEQIDALRIST